jgi:hypothetical protein
LVDAQEDSGIRGGVCTRESNCSRRGRTRTRDGKFHASNVWLSSVDNIGTMKSDNLTTEQVVSGRKVRGNSYINTAFVGEQSINTPGSVGKTIFIDLEPHASCSIIRLGKVHHDGSLVGRVDDIVRSRVGVVVPLDSDGRSSRDWALAISSNSGLR